MQKKPTDPNIRSTVKALIKVMRQLTKTLHHITILQEAIKTQHPQRKLIPMINSWLPTTPPLSLVDWEKPTQTLVVKYTEI